MESYVVSGHGLTINQQTILVPGAIETGDSVEASPNSIYSYGRCGTNMKFSEEPQIVDNLYNGNLTNFVGHSFVYHDSDIVLCSYFLGSCNDKNKNILNITPSGVYKLNDYKSKIKLNATNIVYSRTRSQNTNNFNITLDDALQLYRGAIYPTEDIITTIFHTKTTMLFKDFIISPHISMKMSDLVTLIPNQTPYKLFVLACRGFDECVTRSDMSERLESSGDSGSPDSGSVMLFSDGELDAIANDISEAPQEIIQFTKRKTTVFRKKSRLHKKTLTKNVRAKGIKFTKRRACNLKRRSRKLK